MTLTHHDERSLALTANQRRRDFHRRIEEQAAKLARRQCEPEPPIVKQQEVTQETLKPIWFHFVDAEREPMISEIQAITSELTGVSVRDIKSARRLRGMVRPRQMAMYIARIRTSRSLPEIGRCFGGRDHTTILHACRQIERLMKEDEGIASIVSAIQARLDRHEA